MVSISNPAVNVKDIWEYSNRELSSIAAISPQIVNTLFNSVMGSEFDVNSYGQWIIEGISQKTIDLMNKQQTKDYVATVILATDESRFNFNYCRCANNRTPSSGAGASTNKLTYGLITGGAQYEDGITLGGVTPSFIPVFRRLTDDCINNPESQVNLSYEYAYSSVVDNRGESLVKYPITYKGEQLYAGVIPNTNNYAYVRLLTDSCALNTGNMTSLGTAVECGLIVNGAKCLLTDTLSTVNISKDCTLNRIIISLPIPSWDNYNFELLVNGNIAYSGSLVTGKDAFDSGVITETIAMSPTSTVQFRFTRTSDSSLNLIPVKGITIRVINNNV